ncbi:MAG TPA: hypothetical protein VGJ60_07635 [Chloroflexota bacterium]|jgi:hypothetical protein
MTMPSPYYSPVSSFRGTGFDWEYGNPKRTIQDGALHLSGSILVYDIVELDALFSYVRPCSVRVAGDPSVGGVVYVDHWGPDPSGPLNMSLQVRSGIANRPVITEPVTYTAILVSLSRNEALPMAVHKAEADFLLLVDPASAPDGAIGGTAKTAQTHEETGAPSPNGIGP